MRTTATPAAILVPRIRIEHRLPGRLRLRLDPMVRDPFRLEKDLRGHPGIHRFHCTPVSRSILIVYDRTVIAEAEVVIRIALSISLMHEHAPIRIERSSESGKLDSLAGISGLTLMVLGLLRFLPGMQARTAVFDLLAAVTTGGSILAHAVEELRNEGIFHPETLSVVYLLVSLAQGNGFTGSLLSWLAAYGRHFRGSFIEELILHVEPEQSRFPRKKRYKVSLDSARRRLDNNTMLRYVPALIAHAVSGGSPGDGGFLTDVREVSEFHGHMLEGLEGVKAGIALHIRN